MRHALNIALQGFEGAMVLVSHDRFLLTSVCEDFYLVDSGSVEPFKGDLDDYRDWILKQQAAEKARANEEAKAQQNDENSKPERKIDRKEEKRREAEFRQQIAPFKKAIEKHEKAMEKASSALSEVETALADTSLYSDDKKAELMQLLDKQTSLKQQLEEEEMAWLDAQEEIERARDTYNNANA
jgi:ATP-binding cassette subfamily F protein 3